MSKYNEFPTGEDNTPNLEDVTNESGSAGGADETPETMEGIIAEDLKRRADDRNSDELYGVYVDPRSGHPYEEEDN